MNTPIDLDLKLILNKYCYSYYEDTNTNCFLILLELVKVADGHFFFDDLEEARALDNVRGIHLRTVLDTRLLQRRALVHLVHVFALVQKPQVRATISASVAAHHVTKRINRHVGAAQKLLESFGGHLLLVRRVADAATDTGLAVERQVDTIHNAGLDAVIPREFHVDSNLVHVGVLNVGTLSLTIESRRTVASGKAAISR